MQGEPAEEVLPQFTRRSTQLKDHSLQLEVVEDRSSRDRTSVFRSLKERSRKYHSLQFEEPGAPKFKVTQFEVLEVSKLKDRSCEKFDRSLEGLKEVPATDLINKKPQRYRRLIAV